MNGLRGGEPADRACLTVAEHADVCRAADASDSERQRTAIGMYNDVCSGHLAKVLWWSGDGYCLFSKRLDRGHFVWPQASTGTTVTLSEAQLSMLLEGIDWRRPDRTWRPERAS